MVRAYNSASSKATDYLIKETCTHWCLSGTPEYLEAPCSTIHPYPTSGTISLTPNVIGTTVVVFPTIIVIRLPRLPPFLLILLMESAAYGGKCC